MKVWQEGGAPIKEWTDNIPVEYEASRQLARISRMPFIHKHIAVMPDVHLGKGATVGSVIPTLQAIMPAAVGVDIGCGMIARKTSLKADHLPDALRNIRSAIEADIPHGRSQDGQEGDKGAWSEIPVDVSRACSGLYEEYERVLLANHPKAEHKRVHHHLGTLGTGNHFIEVCLDEEDSVWFMLHSGSRGPGNKIGSYFIDKAKQHMKKWKITLEDPDLAYLVAGEPDFNDYMKFLSWAQRYAATNREVMMARVISALQNHSELPAFSMDNESAINCHHNYVSTETHFGKKVMVTRKGAIKAGPDDLGIIPGSMGTRSYIVRGKGNADSFHSCSHGAGRIMSRTQARKTFTLEDHELATEGVECRKDADVIDETPAAYKNIDDVMEAQKDLVDVVHELRAVICVKG